MTDPAIRNLVFSLIRQHLGRDAENAGAILYNGWDTLRPNNGLYIMGFNPGGSPDDSKTIIDDLKALKDNHCSYQNECWYSSCPQDCQNKEHFGKRPHQKRVRELARLLDFKIEDVFAVNALFLRSKKQDDLKDPWGIFEKCWPIHQYFLSVVKPRTILCLGNGEKSSAFALLKEMLEIKPEQVQFHGRIKTFSHSIAIPNNETINCDVIGVLHPSRFNPVKDLELYLQQNKHSA